MSTGRGRALHARRTEHTTRWMGRVGAAVVATLAVVGAGLVFAATPAVATGGHDGRPAEVAKVTVCHHNEGHFGYTSNTVSVNAVNNVYSIGWNGHGDHGEDIIPLIVAPDGTTLFPGRGDQGILRNGCRVGDVGHRTTVTATAETEPLVVCADGVTLTLVGTGTGSATYTKDTDKAAAQAEALAIAKANAEADLQRQLDGLPGYADGACLAAPPTTPPAPPPTTPEVPAEVEPGPVAVTAPEAGTVPPPEAVVVPLPAQTPAAVAIPQAGTVPSAVAAGDGSSLDMAGLPLWAVVLAALGLAGVAGAGIRLAVRR